MPALVGAGVDWFPQAFSLKAEALHRKTGGAIEPRLAGCLRRDSPRICVLVVKLPVPFTESDFMARSLDAIRRTIDRRFESGRIELPPLPEVAQRVLEKASDPRSAASDLAALVHRDQGLAAEILRDANSGFQAGRVAIVSLQQSIARLGVQRVVEIAIAASIRDGVFSARGYEMELRALWRRALGTGLYAKEVARALRADVEGAFLAGLLRRVGTPLLLRALASLRKPGEKKMSVEDFLDLDSVFRVRLGLAAAVEWNLPEPVREVIAFDPVDGFEGAPVGTMILMVAERLTDLLDEPDEAKDEALRDDPLLDELGLYRDDLDELIEKRDAIRKALDDQE